MRRLKNIGKKIGKFARKGLNFVEGVVNKVDKYTGGVVREALNSASGGLLNEGIDLYNNTKGARNMVLGGLEGQKINKKDLVNNLKTAYKDSLSSNTRNKIYSESKNINDKLNKQLTNLDINDNIKNVLIQKKTDKIDNKIFKR